MAKARKNSDPHATIPKMLRLPAWIVGVVEEEASRSAASGSFSKQIQYELLQRKWISARAPKK